jgi:hypothetical protein
MPEKLITLQLTDEQVTALQTSAISMHEQLRRDKHSDPAEVKFWYQLQDKLMMAKIRQGG